MTSTERGRLGTPNPPPPTVCPDSLKKLIAQQCPICYRPWGSGR